MDNEVKAHVNFHYHLLNNGKAGKSAIHYQGSISTIRTGEPLLTSIDQGASKPTTVTRKTTSGTFGHLLTSVPHFSPQ